MEPLVQTNAGSSKNFLNELSSVDFTTRDVWATKSLVCWLFISIPMELNIVMTKFGMLFAVLLSQHYGCSNLSLFRVLQPHMSLLHLTLSILLFTCTTQLKKYYEIIIPSRGKRHTCKFNGLPFRTDSA